MHRYEETEIVPSTVYITLKEKDKVLNVISLLSKQHIILYSLLEE